MVVKGDGGDSQKVFSVFPSLFHSKTIRIPTAFLHFPLSLPFHTGTRSLSSFPFTVTTSLLLSSICPSPQSTAPHLYTPRTWLRCLSSALFPIHPPLVRHALRVASSPLFLPVPLPSNIHPSPFYSSNS